MSVKNRKFVDQLGVITSGLCAVHCAAIPILLSFGFISTIGGSNHDWVEAIIVCFSFVLGSFSIYNGLKAHGNIFPQWLIAIGAFVVILGIVGPFPNHLLSACGGVVLLYGHWINWQKTTHLDLD